MKWISKNEYFCIWCTNEAVFLFPHSALRRPNVWFCGRFVWVADRACFCPSQESILKAWLHMSFLHRLQFVCDREKRFPHVKIVVAITIICSLSDGMSCYIEAVRSRWMSQRTLMHQAHSTLTKGTSQILIVFSRVKPNKAPMSYVAVLKFQQSSSLDKWEHHLG